MGFAADGLDLRGDLLPHIFLNVGDHDRRSFGGETPRRRRPRCRWRPP